MPTKIVVAHVVVLVVLVVISSTPLVLLPIPVDQEQVCVLRERLWKYLQLSTSHSVSFLHTTSNVRICFLIKKNLIRRKTY